MPSREALLVRTFVEVTDTLVADFDVVELLTSLATHCVEIFDASQAGILLADRDGGLQVVASSSSTMTHLELYELQHDEGPCVDCFRSGRFVASVDLNAELHRWPRFAPEALDAGLQAAWAIPMRLREATIGSLNLLRAEPGTLSEPDLTAAQALADVATVGLIHQRAAEDARLLSDQLQTALDSRVVIEQAKGVLAERRGISMERSFAALRGYARQTNQRLTEVAAAVARRDSDIAAKVVESSTVRRTPN
jgi:transcriptional regulator with GAF, ATPase, and Fis domain